MPTNLVRTEADEARWEKAKAQAATEGKAGKWAYVVSIFENMKGKPKHSGVMHEAARLSGNKT